MSSKQRQKSPVRKRLTSDFSPADYIKNNNKRTKLEVMFVRKLIAKGAIILYKPLNDSRKYDIKEEKNTLLQSNPKSIIFHAIMINGTYHIISNIKYYFILSQLSYKEITQYNIGSIDITIIYYPKTTLLNIKKIIEYINKV